MNPEKIAVGVVLGLIGVLLGVAVFRSEEGVAAPAPVGPTTVGTTTPPPFPAAPPQPVVVSYDEITKGTYRTRQPPKPREAESRPVEAPKTRVVTVKAGDTLARIAKRELGSTAAAAKIAAMNPDVDERNLKVGQKLTIPEAPKADASKKPAPKKSQTKSKSASAKS